MSSLISLNIPIETAILVKIASLRPFAPSVRRNGNKDTIMRPRVESKAPRSVNNTMEYVCAGIRTLNCLGEPCPGISSDAWTLRSQRSKVTQSHNHPLIQHTTQRMWTTKRCHHAYDNKRGSEKRDDGYAAGRRTRETLEERTQGWRDVRIPAPLLDESR